MVNSKIRGLNADEIEVRVGQITAKGASLLLYKDARCDQNILDEVFGSLNWKCRYSRDNANCTVSIWNDAIKEWVDKEDTGTESMTEKEKGLASDSFKRACFKVGIGRELYTAPFIFVACETVPRSNGKGYDLKNKFLFSGAKVSRIEYDEAGTYRKISGLEIVDNKGTVMYTTYRTARKPRSEPKPKPNCITKEQAEILKQKCKEKNSTVKALMDFYELKDMRMSEIPVEVYKDMLNFLSGVEG